MASHNHQRLFFALWPDAETRQDLQGIADGLGGHGGTPLFADDFHITLAFLGKVADEQMPCLLEVASSLSLPSLEIVIDHVELWRRPGILWCGPSTAPAGLLGFVSELQNRLLSCGYVGDKRPYTPHVTLARKAKTVGDFRISAPLKWPVRSFVLASSADGDTPLRYKVIKKWSTDS